METPPARPSRRTFLTVAALITALGAALRAWGVAAQAPSSDDVSVVVSALGFVRHGLLGPTMWNHPPLRNLLVYASTSVFGAGALGVKLISLSLGIATVPLVIAVSRRLLRDGHIALIAGLFMALDPLHIDFSRQAVHEVYMAAFFLGGLYAALRYDAEDKPLWLVASGLLFGLGVASKWYAAFPLVVVVGYLLYRAIAKASATRAERTARAVFIVSALGLLPLAVYFVTFLPWLARGYGLGDWLALQADMARETAVHTGYNPYRFDVDYRAWHWFLMPVAFADFAFSAGRPTVLLGMSNPFVWLLTLPAVAYVAYAARSRADRGRWLLVALFVVGYVPFALTSRPIWAHTAFAVLPFAFMAIACLAWDQLSATIGRRRFLAAYLVVVVVASVPLYLLATGHGLDVPALAPLVQRYNPARVR